MTDIVTKKVKLSITLKYLHKILRFEKLLFDFKKLIWFFFKWNIIFTLK